MMRIRWQSHNQPGQATTTLLILVGTPYGLRSKPDLSTVDMTYLSFSSGISAFSAKSKAPVYRRTSISKNGCGCDNHVGMEHRRRKNTKL